ncbi:MAG: cadherin-like beta sandwich domain-containing protein [Clostridiales bacterium]|jgi:hypothetical protein|nr:cadherin-like beta sandwich domain-containing protein [Clostridiales bacterium]
MKTSVKLSALFFSIIFFISIGFVNIYAAGATVYLNVTDTNITVQSQSVTLSCNINSTESLANGYMTADITYDSSAFTYQKASIGTIENMNDSTLSFIYNFNSDQKTGSMNIFTVTFNLKSTVKAQAYNFGIQNIEIIPDSSADITASNSSVKLTVNNVALSNNTAIKSLMVGTQDVVSTLRRDFPNTVSYAIISVAPEDPNASVTIDGKQNGTRFDFNTGDNNLTIVVTAQNGEKKSYILTVNRAGDTTVPPTQTQTPIPTPTVTQPVQTTHSATTGVSDTNVSPVSPTNATPDSLGDPLSSVSPDDPGTSPSTSPSPVVGDGESGISAWTLFVWVLIALIAGVWVGIFVGFMIWGKRRRSKKLFKY